ncbi:MAG: A/G-specific adenine glycosylase [bacterium]|nr:A/G-specific adenine glycosylase [bacterium]
MSEIMLQQTQVSRVIPKYEEFLKAFPSIQALAKAPKRKLLSVWSGLGYWKRALSLQQAARLVVKKKRFPKDPVELEALPGIGPYTARALACFAFQNSDAFIDTNIRRVYLHFFFPEKKNVSDKNILSIAQKAVRRKSPREWHYALFDYGAMVLKNRMINTRSKHYHRQSAFKNSFRSFRAKAVRFLLEQPRSHVSKKRLEQFIQKEIISSNAPYASKEVISALLRDAIVKESAGAYSL